MALSMRAARAADVGVGADEGRLGTAGFGLESLTVVRLRPERLERGVRWSLLQASSLSRRTRSSVAPQWLASRGWPGQRRRLRRWRSRRSEAARGCRRGRFERDAQGVGRRAVDDQIDVGNGVGLLDAADQVRG